jgi:hypothetical protein
MWNYLGRAEDKIIGEICLSGQEKSYELRFNFAEGMFFPL